jgi:hypothetical protein
MITRRPQTALATVIAILISVYPAALHAQATDQAVLRSATETPVVVVTAVDYAFQAPEVIPAGWTTLRFRNDGEEHHMVFMSRLPDGKTIEDYETELSTPYSRAWQALMEGRADQEEALNMIMGSMPEWFADVHFVGGPGLAGPGVISEVTLDLQPGKYVLECYAKNADGEIHYMEGMIRSLEVSERRSDAPTPAAAIRVTLSNFDMAIDGNLTPGRHTVAVHVEENPEQGFGHSVHVARLDGTEPGKVVEWMNWFNLQGLREPAPARFVGGLHPFAAGETAYFTLELEPGRYLFVSEGTGAQGVRREVTVR